MTDSAKIGSEEENVEEMFFVYAIISCKYTRHFLQLFILAGKIRWGKIEDIHSDKSVQRD